MDDAINTLRNVVHYALSRGDMSIEDVSIEVSTMLLKELFDRIDQTPACIRQVSSHDLLVELLNREARRERFPEAMRTLVQEESCRQHADPAKPPTSASAAAGACVTSGDAGACCPAGSVPAPPG